MYRPFILVTELLPLEESYTFVSYCRFEKETNALIERNDNTRTRLTAHRFD